MTVITLNIQTDDLALVAKLAAALNPHGMQVAVAPPVETVAPTPPPIEATAPTPPPIEAAAGKPELDSDGLPWDERINTSNKATRQDGTWKRKPGITDDYYAQVIAELKVARPHVAPPSQPMGGYMPASELQKNSIFPAIPEPANNEPMTFGQLVQKITAAKLPRERVEAALANAGIQQLPQLMQRPDAIEMVAKELGL
jgi:hypothetical protein